jgi:hypothetical protein
MVRGTNLCSTSGVVTVKGRFEMTEQRAPSPEMLQEQIDRIEEIFGGKE